MKKTFTYFLTGCLVLFTIHPVNIYAEDFGSNEGYWQNKCSIAQTSQEDKNKCEQFRQYYEDKRATLNNELASLSGDVESLRTNISNVNEIMKKADEQLNYYTDLIATNDANIQTITEQMNVLDVNIKKKQAAIEKRSKLIKDRMKSEQPTLGSQLNFEILMGSNDLLDMIRRINGIQKITDSDQKEIAVITKEKKKLAFDKSEKKRLKIEAQQKQAENIKNKEAVETLKAQQEEIVTLYHQQEAQLVEQMRSVNVSISSLGDSIIQIRDPESVDVGGAVSGSNGFLHPVQNAGVSAGTWAYPSGGVHLGMDFAVNVGTTIYAPSNGIILYANNPCATYSGFYGNFGPGSGYPAGGGNTIHLLTQVNGTTYGISFYHLAKENFAVQAGMNVVQGQALAKSGSSGNVDGAHCHIEVVNLGTMSIASAITRFQSTADFAWGTGWYEQGVNNRCEVKGAPCRQRPETIF